MTKYALRTAAILLATSLTWSTQAAVKGGKGTCQGGKILVRGECVTPCPKAGMFADPSACECPSGFGKILLGNGGGECKPLACPLNVEIDARRPCDCPESYKKQGTRKGKTKCVLHKAAQAKGA